MISFEIILEEDAIEFECVEKNDLYNKVALCAAFLETNKVVVLFSLALLLYFFSWKHQLLVPILAASSRCFFCW